VANAPLWIIKVDEYEVLVGDMNRLCWVPTSGKLNVANLRYRPVEGGRENDGTPLYIAEAPHKDAVHPGKASQELDGTWSSVEMQLIVVINAVSLLLSKTGAYIAYGGKEKNVKVCDIYFSLGFLINAPVSGVPCALLHPLKSNYLLPPKTLIQMGREMYVWL